MKTKFARRALILLAVVVPLAIFWAIKEVASWRPIRVGGSNGGQIIISPDGKRLVIYGEYLDAKYRPDFWNARGWNLETGENHFLSFGQFTPHCFSPDSRSVLGLHDSSFAGFFSGGDLAQLRDFESGRLRAGFADRPVWPLDDMQKAQITADNRLLVANEFEGLRVYNSLTARLKKRVTLHPHPPTISYLRKTNLSNWSGLSKNCKQLMTTNPPALWDVESGRCLQIFPVPPCNRASVPVFASDLSVVIWENQNDTGPRGAGGWSVTDPLAGRVLWQVARGTWGLAISPDSRSVVLSTPQWFEWREIRTSRLIRRLPKPNSAVYEVHFSPDGNELFYVSDNGDLIRRRLR